MQQARIGPWVEKYLYYKKDRIRSKAGAMRSCLLIYTLGNKRIAYVKLLKSFMLAAPICVVLAVLCIVFNDSTGSMVYDTIGSTIAIVCLIGLLPSAIYGYICLLRCPSQSSSANENDNV